VVAALCLMLSTPLLDPLGLAVKSQISRLERDPATFDSSWLQQRAGRSGQEALTRFENRPAPAPLVPAASPAPAPPAPLRPAHLLVGPKPAVQAAAALRPIPVSAAPRAAVAALRQAAPEPEGDIILHTAGEFPASLLAQDWSGADAAPCLAKANKACDAWLLDLDGDGRKEILLAYGDGPRVRADVIKQSRGGWIAAASVASAPCQGLLARMRDREGEPLPGWRRALAAGLRQRPDAQLPCPRS
jgi:hypothetical protein